MYQCASGMCILCTFESVLFLKVSSGFVYINTPLNESFVQSH